MTTKKSIPTRNPFSHIQTAIDLFYESYPVFHKAGKLTFCSCLYYPLANLELNVREASSEEFDTIEHTILEIIYSGIKEPSEIAKMMGLTEKYVMKLIRILEGYGHVLDMEVQDIGKRSVKDGVKYRTYQTTQRVQADPLFWQLLSKEMYQPNHQLLSIDETKRNIPHMQPNPFVDEQLFQALFHNLDEYKRAKKKVFHMNVEKVEGVVSKKIQYAYAYLLLFEGLKDPIAILQHKKSKYVENPRDAYYWKPLAVSESAARTLGLTSDEFHLVEDSYFEPFVQTVKEVRQQLEKQRERFREFPQNVEGRLLNDWGIEAEEVQFDINQTHLTLYVSPENLDQMHSTGQNQNHPYVKFAANHLYPGLVCYPKVLR
nr:hypothetical protein [Fredinandcohnia onubensis]